MNVRSIPFLVSTLVCFLSITAGAKTVVRDKYLTFSDRADFESYLEKSFPGPFSQLLEHSDPRYARMEAILQRVWTAYQQFSPDRAADLPVPQLAILKGKLIDGFVDEDADHFTPDAFFIYEKTMEFSDEAIAGLMGHELTHLLFFDFNFKYYKVSGGVEPLGYLQANDPSIESIVKEWQSITEVVGPFVMPELNGLPAAVVYDGKLFNIISQMAKDWGDKASAQCQSIMNPFPKWRIDLVLHYFSMVDQVVRMTDSERIQLEEQTRAYVSDFRACLGQRKGQLIPLLVESLNKPATELQAKYGGIAKTFDQEANVVDGLFAVTGQEYKKLEAFASTHDLTSYRSYTNEEIADDNSARVLKLAGYAPTGIGEFFLQMMDDAQPGASAQCLAIIESGKVPPYGIITDSHHSACFRIYHVRKLAESL